LIDKNEYKFNLILPTYIYKITTLLHSETHTEQTNMASQKYFVYLSFFLCFIFLVSNAVEVTHDGRAIKIDGKRRVLISGSIHYPRSTPQVSN
jgi:hypothetical protein